MILLYTWKVPNGQKISIALEELGLPYTVHPIDITKNEQYSPAFSALTPNNKVPVIVDDEGPKGKKITVMESGAILIYLSGKVGQLLPARLSDRFATFEWLMFQASSVGPILEQARHFLRFAPEVIPYAIEHYSKEASRIYSVIDARLKDRPWLAGKEYSIADIATYPWLAQYKSQGMDLKRFPNIGRWLQVMQERPSVQRGMEVPE